MFPNHSLNHHNIELVFYYFCILHNYYILLFLFSSFRIFFHHKESKKEEIENKYGLKCYYDWRELISNDNIDGIIIATPPESRFELAKEALKNKKHLLLEKPVAITSEEIEILQRIALRDNLSVCVDFEYRVVPHFLQAKEIIDQNKLGNIYLIKLDWIMSSRSNPEREWNWYSLSNLI